MTNKYLRDNLEDRVSGTVDNFDRLMGSLHGLPDGACTDPSTIQVVPTLGVGGVETFIVQTYRQRDIGDNIFLQHISPSGTTRLVIPPKVADAIARQRDRLTTKVRSKAGKRTADARKAAGILPGFMKGRAK